MQVIEWAFGKRLTPQERLRKNQRALERTQRELKREKQKLEKQEKQLITDIKKSAKSGNTSAAKIQAKDLIRTRKYVEKFNMMSTQLQAISLRIQTVRSNEQMTASMKDATKVLGGMNKSMNLPQLAKIAMEFEKQNDIMDQRQEMMDDAIDDAMGEDELDEEEADEIVSKVLDEIGVDLNQAMNNTPDEIRNAVSQENGKQAIAVGGGGPHGSNGDNNEDDDLQSRLDRLKK